MKKSALIMWGGWDGHTPKETGEALGGKLRENGYNVRIENSLQPLENKDDAAKFDLIIPIWTMGQMSDPQWQGLNHAVHEAGTGLAGVHGGMGDAFRGRVDYYWLVGGQFLGHPYCGKYTVKLTSARSPITKGMKKSFAYDSEQYYMGVDPANRVLATTLYKFEGQRITMPVVWTKTWGKGRVFYSALGHCAREFIDHPEVLAMTIRGMLWAAGRKTAC